MAKKWSLGQFLGWGLGGALGNGIAGGGLNLATGVGFLLSAGYCALGGFLGGIAGYLLSFLLDDPSVELEKFNYSFLFGTVFSLLFSTIFGFLSLDFMLRTYKYTGNYPYYLSIVIGFLSGFICSGLGGVVSWLSQFVAVMKK